MSAVHVTVRVGAELYALPVEAVREIAELGHVTPVPGARAETIGLQNLRGSALPVYDLAAVLGIPSGDAQRIAVVEAQGCRAGLAVDEACDVGELPDADEEAHSSLLLGAALTDHGLIGILDLDRLFDALRGATAA
jgi:purine-binding chemotaxis protein CheW